MPDKSAEITRLKAEVEALRAELKRRGREPADAPRCARCGLILNGPAINKAGRYYHKQCISSR